MHDDPDPAKPDQEPTPSAEVHIFTTPDSEGTEGEEIEKYGSNSI
ncbi:hypothetical protein GCM10010306_062820 [Streptomyces umbrinus]|nr:hypothetical protein [Streptomyces umbrinus]GHB60662.1 hypothetical protein GCM10010306_062820 [Streptomyces umbrinus]